MPYSRRYAERRRRLLNFRFVLASQRLEFAAAADSLGRAADERLEPVAHGSNLVGLAPAVVHPKIHEIKVN